jgi:transcription elongation factor/antiterminator RfaH
MRCILAQTSTFPETSAVGTAVDGRPKSVSNASWYVVHTQPRAEGRAVYHLEMQGYPVFCPRYRRTVRHARKRRSVLAPLFPNYLFLRLDISRDQWRSVNGTRGVVHLLMRDGRPQPVPTGIIEGLQSRTRADGTMDWTPTFKVGAAVRIADGPFAEFLGTLDYFDAAGRVRVLLDILGRSVSVALRGEAVLPAT